MSNYRAVTEEFVRALRNRGVSDNVIGYELMRVGAEILTGGLPVQLDEQIGSLDRLQNLPGGRELATALEEMRRQARIAADGLKQLLEEAGAELILIGSELIAAGLTICRGYSLDDGRNDAVSIVQSAIRGAARKQVPTTEHTQ